MRGRIKYIISSVFIIMAACAMLNAQSPSPYKVVKLPISNNSFNEMAPSLFKDGIVFISDRRVSAVRNVTTYRDEKIFNIFVAVKTDTVRWETPKEVKDLGNKLVAYGAVCVGPDGKTVYFSRTVLSGKAATKRKASNPYGIFIGDLNGTEISNVRPFEYNDPAFSYDVIQPSVSRDGKYLFFASNMPGGQGGSDIYFCENISGKWGKPVNLGPKVNTPSLENYPFMHPSGRLYFSSDRPSSAPYMGNMDVYFTTLLYGAWDTPVPLPEPINSKEDDYAFIAEDNLQTGYFTRNSKPTTDIWSFKSTMIRKLSCDSLKLDSYCYRFEETNASKFDTVLFRYVWSFGDGTKAVGLRVEHCFPGPGKYHTTLDITNLVTNITSRAEKSFPMDLNRIQQAYISSASVCQEGQQITLDADSTNLPDWNIAQFYWNFGDESSAIGKQTTHKFTKAGEYSVQLIVTSAPGADGTIKEACVSKNIRVKRIP